MLSGAAAAAPNSQWVLTNATAGPMLTHAEFRSDAFPPYADEADQVNSGRYGKRLAEFLVDGLRGSRFEPTEPISEDWGWVVPLRHDAFSVWIGCGNAEEHDDAFLIFIEPHRPTVRRWLFWKVDTTAAVQALQRELHRLLSGTPKVRDLRWYTYDEFMRPGRKNT